MPLQPKLVSKMCSIEQNFITIACLMMSEYDEVYLVLPISF